MRLTLPVLFDQKLDGNPGLKAAIHSALAKYSDFLAISRLPFFPDFTDHGMTHPILSTRKMTVRKKRGASRALASRGTLALGDLRNNGAMRRTFLIATGVFGGLVYFSSRRGAEDEPAGSVEIMEFDGSGARTVERVVRTPAEWKARLTAQQYYVTRQGSTDTPFTGTYHSLQAKGLYRCVCCGTGVFRSSEKFDSGTGWPSFWAPADERNVRTRKDVSLLLERTEVACRRCGAHLGHVFSDGPEPTHLRFCINESALRFVEAT